MNKARRQALTSTYELISQIRTIVELVHDEEEEAYENMPESIQYSDRGEQMSANVYELDNLLYEIDAIEESIDNIVSGW